MVTIIAYCMNEKWPLCNAKIISVACEEKESRDEAGGHPEEAPPKGLANPWALFS